MDGETVKYRFYKKNSQSLITIPKPIAKSLNWEDKDDIHMVIKNVDDKVGLFLFKEE
jgi:bifunctional DNA-binding transcriptional regulator/antitoxin component of YhaV-PrlF toxin-antitoxin module